MNFDVLENGFKNFSETYYDLFGKKIQIGDIVTYSHTHHGSFAVCVVVSVEKDGDLRVIPLKEKPVWLNIDYRYSAKLNPKTTPCIVLSSLIQTQNPDIYKEAQDNLEKFYSLTKQGRAKKKCMLVIKYNPEEKYIETIPEVIEYFSTKEIETKAKFILEKYKDQENIFILDKQQSFVKYEDVFKSSNLIKNLYLFKFTTSWYFTNDVYKLDEKNVDTLLHNTKWIVNDVTHKDDPRYWKEMKLNDYYTSSDRRDILNSIFCFFYKLNKISYILTDNNVFKLLNPNELKWMVKNYESYDN